MQPSARLPRDRRGDGGYRAGILKDKMNTKSSSTLLSLCVEETFLSDALTMRSVRCIRTVVCCPHCPAPRSGFGTPKMREEQPGQRRMQLCRAHADGGRVRAQAGILSTAASAGATRAREMARAARKTKGVHEREAETKGARAKQRLPKPSAGRSRSRSRSPHGSSTAQLTHAKRALRLKSARSPEAPPSAPAASASEPVDPLAMCERVLESAFLSTTALVTRAALEAVEASRAKRDAAKSDQREHAQPPPPKPKPARALE